MTIRFFLLQAHYRSTIDFSNEALQAAEKGYKKLMKAKEALYSLKPSSESTADISSLKQKCYEAMDDDLNTPGLLSGIFEGVRLINSVNDGGEKLTNADLESLKNLFDIFVFEILGLKDETASRGNEKLTDDLMRIIIDLRQQAKNSKEWALADHIRQELKKAGISLKDLKDGADWEIE